MTTISSPTELITAIPFLLDGEPSDALVIIALSRGSIQVLLHVGLDQLSKEPERESAHNFLAPLHGASIDHLLLLAYLPEECEQELAEQLCQRVAQLCEKSAPVKDFLIIQSGRWRSFLCTDEGCCDRQGQPLPDIASSQMAAEHVFQGLVMPELSEHSGELTLGDQIERARCAFEQSPPHLRSKRGVIALLRLISDFTLHHRLADHRLIADALIALTDIHVRDFGIGSHGDEHLDLHLLLWDELLQIAPEGYRAPVATLLALVCYESGDSARARRELERALTDDPHYSLAHLLQKTFAAGWPPEAFTTMRHELHPKLRAELLG